MSKKITSILLCLSMVLSCFMIGSFATQAATSKSESVSVNSNSESVSAKDYGLADNIQNGVILHCWNWSYNNIKKYLPQIAEAGYTAVQTSPVTQPKDYYWEGIGYGNVGIPDGVGGYDGNWWKIYQPVTESICNNGYTWYGTKAEFKSMCDEAEKYGIKVIVDIVANHMGNIKGYKIGSVEEVMGDISPQVGQFWNPNMLTDPSYWHISTSWTHSSDGRFDVTQGNMGMPDLNTGDSKVQNMILSLLKECIDNGADGFRFDAAKHIETPADDPEFASSFWDVVLDGATSYAQKTKNFTPYYYGEVLNRIDSDAAENYYLSKMSVTDNSTGDNIRNSLKYGQVGGASNSGYCGYAHGKGNKVVLWAESHDTYMGGGSSYDCNDSTINKAWAVVASRKDSTGLYFARPYYSYERLIDDQNGYEARKDASQMAKEIRQTQMGEVGTLTWMDTCVAEVNRFRNHFIGQSENLGNSGDSLFYNVRGNSGVVIVSSKGPCSVSINLGGKMKDGTYTEQISGKKFTVSGGTIKGSITNSDGIAVVYNADTVPRNTIEAPRENFAADSAKITVGLNNAVSGTYSINGASPIKYTDDTSFTIGSGDAEGTQYVITLTATDGKNSTSSTYTFTKESKTVKYPLEEGYTTPVVTTQPTTAPQPSTAAPTTKPQERILVGDVNLDETININDATAIQKYLVGLQTLSDKSMLAADTDGKDGINIIDATRVMFYSAGMPERSGNCGKYIEGSVKPTNPEPEPTTVQPQPGDNYIYAKGYTHAYFWSDSQADIGGAWPGSAMQSIGNNIYRVAIPDGATNVIFSNNGSGQTHDLTILGAGKIYENGSWKNYGTQDATQSTTSSSDNYIYAKGYTHVYFWSDSQADIGGAWPGSAMESIGNNIYRAAIPDGAECVIFSNNGQGQTADLTIPGAGKIYENNTWKTYN